MAKLKAHGIEGQVANWISDWLSNRMQRICICDNTSGWRLIMSRLPQRSVLGPLLFLIFINDLDLVYSKIFIRVMTPAERSQLQKDLDTLCEWAENWQMTFNVNKCKVMQTETITETMITL